jgi:hypothetical protein
MVAPVLLTPDAKDVQSYARPAEARVTHVALDLDADFEAKRLGGTATLDLQAAPGAREIVLDSKGLVIAGITDGRGRQLPYTEGDADPAMGAPLTVTLNGARRIIVSYKSAPDAEALQWLSPEQTAAGGSRSCSARASRHSTAPGSRRRTARDPPDLGSADQRSGRASGRHERDPRGKARSHAAAARPEKPLFLDGQAGRALSDRDRGGRPCIPAARPAQRRLCRAGDAAPRRRGAPGHREDDRRRRGALRPLSLGPLRHDRAAARLSLWRDGKSHSYVPDAHLHRRRPEPRRAGRARARAQLVR